LKLLVKSCIANLTQKKTIVSVYLGGVLSNSTAVVTDATHMGIDVASFVISLSAMYLATKQPTRHLSFGYVRAGLLF
jgi:Co/Zn/Cd efflux system component